MMNAALCCTVVVTLDCMVPLCCAKLTWNESMLTLQQTSFWQKHKQEMFRNKVILQCCTYALEQAARQASPSKRHCFFSAAAEITSVFNFVILSLPSPLSLPRALCQWTLTLTLTCLPSLNVILPSPPPPTSTSFAKCKHVVFLRGVRLRSTTGHRH